MEDKADRANLCLKEADGAISMTVQATTDYAVNGALHYAQHILQKTTYKKVFAFGNAGDSSYGSDFDTAWLNALYTDVYEYSGKYSNQVAWERFTEYMVFYDEVVDYNNELAPAPALYDVYYAYDPATEEEAALCVDDVIQIAEENGAEIQIW